MATFTESMAAHVLAHDDAPIRFEDFCVELFRDMDGVEYVRTSQSWDHGKDGRDASALARTPTPFICCSLRDDVLVKAVEDIERFRANADPKVLLVCSASPVSEHLAIKIESRARELCPGLETVRVNGQTQLIQIARRYPRAMEMQYAGELAELRAVYSAPSPADEGELSGLRIALTTQLHDDAQLRRQDLVQVLILTALERQAPLSDQAIASGVSQALHLPRVISVSFIDAELANLAAAKLIIGNAREYELTSAGREEIDKRQAQADKSLSDGQGEIRALIEDLTGAPLSTKEWTPIWNILKDGLTRMFLSQGTAIVECIASIHSGMKDGIERADLKNHIDGIANRVRSMTGGGGRLNDVAQAISDLFQERTSKAFEWLSSLCVVYVDMCCLGLEPNAQQQVVKEVAHFDLLLDTDVVLSLLSEGEHAHDSVVRIVEGWQKIGGRVFVAIPVLEEAAHHAWISDATYQDVWRHLDKMTDEDAQHIVDNVFVRGFRAVAGGKFGRRRWDDYIRAFKGNDDHDYEKILGLLGDLGITLLPNAVQDDALAQKVETELFQIRKTGVGNDPRDIRALQEKCNRDGRMAALLIGQRLRLATQRRTVVIVSTSRALRQAVASCKDQLQGGEPVMYIGAIAWLLSLIPGVNLSVGVLRGVMFDPGFRKHLSPFERTVMRAVHASEQYEMHWSRRSTLHRAVREEIGRIAVSRGQKVEDVSEEIANRTEAGVSTLSEAVASAMDKTAVSLYERDMAALQERVKELEQALQSRSKSR